MRDRRKVRWEARQCTVGQVREAGGRHRSRRGHVEARGDHLESRKSRRRQEKVAGSIRRKREVGWGRWRQVKAEEGRGGRWKQEGTCGDRRGPLVAVLHQAGPAHLEKKCLMFHNFLNKILALYRTHVQLLGVKDCTFQYNSIKGTGIRLLCQRKRSVQHQED